MVPSFRFPNIKGFAARDLRWYVCHLPSGLMRYLGSLLSVDMWQKNSYFLFSNLTYQEFPKTDNMMNYIFTLKTYFATTRRHQRTLQ